MVYPSDDGSVAPRPLIFPFALLPYPKLRHPLPILVPIILSVVWTKQLFKRI